MILAIALFGLSISLLRKRCSSEFSAREWCILPPPWAFGEAGDASRTVRYGIFLGLYGMLISAIGIVALFIDRIPTKVPLLGDSFAALCFLAGGIAWVVNRAFRPWTCSKLKELPNSELGNFVGERWKKRIPNLEDENKAVRWIWDVATSACRQADASHGLVWALFAFTICLVICGYLRRRDQAKSSK